MSTSPTYVYAALLDILGYRSHLEADRRSGELNFQGRLIEAMNTLSSINDAEFRLEAISDTIILTCGNRSSFPEFAMVLKSVFIAFMEHDLLLRGGVSYSQHFHNSRVTYSHAIARSYELESLQASYPRIVIDENIVDMHSSGEGLPVIAGQNLICKENGVYFINILDRDNWSTVYSHAARIFDINRSSIRQNESAFNKYVMFERYLLSSHWADPSQPGFTGSVSAF